VGETEERKAKEGKEATEYAQRFLERKGETEDDDSTEYTDRFCNLS